MKKFIVILVLMMIVGGVAEIFFLRPETVSVDAVKSEYEKNRECYETIGYYLAENNISADIKGVLTDDETYGVPVISDASYVKFNAAVQIVMGEKITEIISADNSVEFLFESTGGGATKLSGKLIYGGEKEGSVKINDDWYMIVQ